MSRSILTIFTFLYCFALFGQEPVTIVFKPVYGNKTIVWNDSSYPSKQFGSVKFETLKLYISGIAFLDKGTLISREANSFHLLDAAHPESLRLEIPYSSKQTYNTLKFNIGIDSLTNVSGAMGGALDPSKGMYWTWQSGYINMKLEGSCSACPLPKHEFQFHLGGYQWPFNTLQSATLSTGNNRYIEVAIDLERFFDAAATGRNHIMSPCAEAAKLSEVMRDCFKVVKK